MISHTVAGSLQAVHPHISQREDLVSFLCFIVLSGEGELSYEEHTYQLSEGDCVFIDCRKAYSHSTSDNLWSLQWCHFYAPSLPAVYEKYKERGGQPVFHPEDIAPLTSLLTDLYNLASSSDYIRDMRINEKLGTLLTLLMEQSWHPESVTVSRKRMELVEIKNYLDEHYTEKVTLDDLAERFFINKFYLSKIFKETYGTTVNNYLISKRITRAKQLLRFTDMWTFEEKTGNGWRKILWHSGKTALIFSVGIETLQLLLRLGTFQLSDIFYNTVGGVIGGLMCYGIRKVRKRL